MIAEIYDAGTDVPVPIIVSEGPDQRPGISDVCQIRASVQHSVETLDRTDRCTAGHEASNFVAQTDAGVSHETFASASATHSACRTVVMRVDEN